MPRYIDVDEAKRCFLDCAASEQRNDHIENARAMKFAADCLDGIRTADVTPVIHGHWDVYCCSRFLGWKNGDARWADGKYYYCSLCRRRTVIRENYCPKSGAKMDEKEK